MISCRDGWPWTKPGYITMTRRQSNNQCSGGIAAHPAPKYSECKNPMEKFSPRFFGIKTASSSFIIFQRAKLSTRSIITLCWCNWRTFWRKNAALIHQLGSCSCTTMPRLTGHLQLKSNWPIWASSVLITHPIHQIWPLSNYHLFPGLKDNWKVAIFRPTRRSLLSRRPGWTDNLLIFFFLSGLQKLEQQTKKWGVCWINPELVAVTCFLPGRGKDLSASRIIQALIKTFITRWRGRQISVFLSSDISCSQIYQISYKPKKKLILLITTIYLSRSWATCLPVPVSRIQKSLQRSTIVPSARWRVVFHYPG